VSEALIVDFQLAEIVPTIQVFLVCFAVGLGAAIVKGIVCRAKKNMNTLD
jgi:hypothetical protein